jgi:hypothetical protein
MTFACVRQKSGSPGQRNRDHEHRQQRPALHNTGGSSEHEGHLAAEERGPVPRLRLHSGLPDDHDRGHPEHEHRPEVPLQRVRKSRIQG